MCPNVPLMFSLHLHVQYILCISHNVLNIFVSISGEFFCSIDPGHTNMLFGRLFYLGYDYTLYMVKDIKLECKKGDYYEKAGFNKHSNDEAKWMKPFAQAFENMSLHSTKTTDLDQLRQNLELYGEI